MWEYKSGSLQGRGSKVISTALIEDPLPDYICPALVSLIAKHAPQDLDLFEPIFKSLKNHEHVFLPEAHYQEKDSEARTERQTRNKGTTTTACFRSLSPPSRYRRHRNTSPRLLIFPPETHKSSCPLPESKAVPLQNSIQKIGNGEEVPSAINLNSQRAMEEETSNPLEWPHDQPTPATMTSTMTPKCISMEACVIQQQESVQEVPTFNQHSDETGSRSCSSLCPSPYQLEDKDPILKEGSPAACVKAINNHSQQIRWSVKACMLDSRIKPIQASNISLSTSKRLIHSGTHKLADPKKTENEKPDNVDLATERRSSRAGNSHEKPWRNGMKLLKHVEEGGWMSTRATTEKGRDRLQEKASE